MASSVSDTTSTGYRLNWLRNRGVGEILAAGIVLSVVTGLLFFSQISDNQRNEDALARKTGAYIGTIFTAAHYYVQDRQSDYSSQLAAAPLIPLSLATLKSTGSVSDGLWDTGRNNLTVHLGVADDGYGVPMAIMAITPPLSDIGQYLPIIHGAQNVGVIRVFNIGQSDNDHDQARSEDLLEKMLGSPAGNGTLYLRADSSLFFDNRILYDRPQPGHPLLSVMNADLKFSNNAGIKEVGNLEARKVSLAETLDVDGTTSIKGTMTMAGETTSLTNTEIQGVLEGDDAQFANSVEGQTLLVNQLLQTGTMNVHDAIVTQNADVSGQIATGGDFVSQKAIDTDDIATQKSTLERIDTNSLTTQNIDAEGVYAPAGKIDTVTADICFGCQ